MNRVEISVKRVDKARDLPLPSYATPGSAGMDLYAAVDVPLRLASGARALVPTGICLAIPPGYEGQVRPRSGLALDRGLTLLNSPGTIDSDYRGQVRVILINLGQQLATIQRGERIAQLVVAPVVRVEWLEQNDWTEWENAVTRRGENGFGSTGK